MTLKDKLLKVAFSHGEGYLKKMRRHNTEPPGKWQTINEPLIKVSDAMYIIDKHMDEVLKAMLLSSPDMFEAFKKYIKDTP